MEQNKNTYHHFTIHMYKWYINKIIMDMDSNNELKEMDINKCMCYYIDDIIKIEDFDPDSILINKKSFENIWLRNILYKNLIDSKPLHIRFDKKDEFIRVCDGTGFLVLLRIVKYDYSY